MGGVHVVPSGFVNVPDMVPSLSARWNSRRGPQTRGGGTWGGARRRGGESCFARPPGCNKARRRPLSRSCHANANCVSSTVSKVSFRNQNLGGTAASSRLSLRDESENSLRNRRERRHVFAPSFLLGGQSHERRRTRETCTGHPRRSRRCRRAASRTAPPRDYGGLADARSPGDALRCVARP